MAVIDHIDWINRRIYLAAATLHPIEIYQEYRTERRTNEVARPYNGLVRYEGYVAKGGGRFTPRYMVMLNGAKIVPVDGATEPITTITGEIITDDQTEFIDVSPLTVYPLVKYQPPEAEVIEVITSGGDPEQIADAVMARTVEGTLTLTQALRLMNATLFGKLSGADTDTVHIRDLADSKDRVVASVDASGNRSSVTIDPN
jgi:hypothetical protein